MNTVEERYMKITLEEAAAGEVDGRREKGGERGEGEHKGPERRRS